MRTKYAEPETDRARFIAGASLLLGLAYVAITLYDAGYTAGYADSVKRHETKAETDGE